MNAVMNLWVSFSGRTLLHEFSFLPVQKILLRSVRVCYRGVVYQSVRIRHFFLCSQKVLKYVDTNVIEFQNSRRNFLMKIHTNVFVLKLSSVLKCFYGVSQLLLHDSSDLRDNHFDFMNFVSVNFLS